MRVQDLMSRSVERISSDAKASDASNRMKLKGIRHLVVMRDGQAVGILSDRDLGGRRGTQGRGEEAVGSLMSPHTVTVKPDTTLRRAANLMRGHVIGCLPVVEDGKLRGIITVSDLLDCLGRGAESPSPRGRRATLNRRRGKQKGHA